MTLEKAIKELSLWETRFHDYNDPQMTGAVKLGIEALKAVKRNRHALIIDYQITLPGETDG